MNKLGFGFLRLPTDRSSSNGDYDWPLVCSMVDRYLAAGKTYFDTAYTYLDGDSEIGLRECLVKRHPRNSFQICDKLPGYLCRTREDCWKYFHEQQKRCGVEYFDVYMLHWLNGSHFQIAEKTGQFEFLQELKKQGLAKRIGFSYHDSAELLNEILEKHPEVDVVLLQINYLDWKSEGIQSGKCYDVCVKHEKQVIVMEPVKGGTLASLPEKAEVILRTARPEWSAVSWAVRFAESLPQVEIVLSGMNSMEQLEDNLQEHEWMTEEERHLLDRVSGMILSDTIVACTGCGYCVSYCPMELPIPDYFRMLNEQHRYPEDSWKIGPAFEQLASRSGRASDCIACGACVEHCPQKIDIPVWMREVERNLSY